MFPLSMSISLVQIPHLYLIKRERGRGRERKGERKREGEREREEELSSVWFKRVPQEDL